MPIRLSYTPSIVKRRGSVVALETVGLGLLASGFVCVLYMVFQKSFPRFIPALQLSLFFVGLCVNSIAFVASELSDFSGWLWLLSLVMTFGSFMFHLHIESKVPKVRTI